jgi:hypothetical protein
MLVEAGGNSTNVPAPGRRPAFPRFALLFAALIGAAAAGEAGDALGQLMQRLALRRHGHATFVERQFLAILNRPLESSGELYYDAPDRLEKRTLRPKPENLVLDHGLLTVRRGTHSYQLPLVNYPQLAPFIDSIRATLAGDLPGLERVYVLTFESAAGDWTLVLVPREAELAALIARIRLSGAGDQIREISVERADGDRSVMTISDLPGT